MVRFRKFTERDFSVYRAAKSLRRISPALVSLVIQGKRNVTLDRAEEFAKLLNLNAGEKAYFRNWIGQMEDKDFIEATPAPRSRKDVGLGILSDWLNVYVKDFFHLPAVQKDASLVEKQLLGVATPKRIQKSLQFLLREGYLRKTLDGSIVVETEAAVSEPVTPSRRVRQFHRGALSLAKLALELYPKEERLANTLIVDLDEEKLKELYELIAEFAEKLKDFDARKTKPGNRLYQLIINLSPIGGKLE
jgi:uncharacterized protein (TIGR02147 family)